MNVAVIGGGVVGVTTADALQRAGCTVTIFDRHTEPARETSFANAGQLAYGNATPLASPEVLVQLPAILLGRSPGIRIRPQWRLSYWRWCLAFLYHCLPSAYDKSYNALSNLAKRSADLMNYYHQSFGCEYHFEATGKLVLSNKPANGSSTSDAQGVTYLNSEELFELEPALRSWNTQHLSARFSANDEVGDACKFTHALLRRVVANGVTTRFGSDVTELRRESGYWSVTAATTDKFDAVVVCAGNGVTPLLADIDPKIDVHPVGGFSYTLPKGPNANKVSVTIARERTVFSPIGTSLRVAGFATVNPNPDSLATQAQQLLETARRIAPDAADYSGNPQPWIGYRPTTPDSLPRVGAGPQRGLFYNFGHGMLGWTLCAATAEAISRQVIAS